MNFAQTPTDFDWLRDRRLSGVRVPARESSCVQWASLRRYLYPLFFDHPDIKNFKILYFASAKEAAGVVSELIPLDTEEMSIPQLFEKLEASHPNLKKKKILSSVAVAVNLEYVEIASGKIRAGDEVAIIPPVSGGWLRTLTMAKKLICILVVAFKTAKLNYSTNIYLSISRYIGVPLSFRRDRPYIRPVLPIG